MPASKNSKSVVSKLFRKQGEILDISITSTPKQELLAKIETYLSEKSNFEAKKPLFITTPNPEQVVLASDDPSFAKILNKSDISLCDGTGLLIGLEYLTKYQDKLGSIKKNYRRKVEVGSVKINKYVKSARKKQKFAVEVIKKVALFVKSSIYVLKNNSSTDGSKVIKGREFVLRLLDVANTHRYKVFLLGSTINVISRTKEILTKKYPAVRFQFEYDLKVDLNGVPVSKKHYRNEELVVNRINRFHPQMLFVAFGAPKQEKWVYRCLKNLNVDLVMVCGSAFDHIAGTRKQVPPVVSRFGMEWLWRLFTGSQTVERIHNAVFRFPILLLNSD